MAHIFERYNFLNKKGLGTGAAISARTAVVSSTLVGAAIVAAPLAGGLSLLAAGAMSVNTGISGVASAALLEERNRPEDVYFQIVYGGGVDNTWWVAKSVLPGGVWQVANNVVQWSNQVFWERYVNQKSNEFQTYVYELTSF